MPALVFNQVGIPVEGIGLILGIDRLLDMLRTAVNVTGGSLSLFASVVARTEQKLNLWVFKDPKAAATID